MNPILTPAEIERFWSKVDKAGDCWNWTRATITAGGYGCFHIARYGTLRAHRVAFLLMRGPVPDGKQVLHRCDNPRCVNPDHLYVGTDQDNANDRVARGRQPRGDSHWMAKMPERICRGEKASNVRLKDGDIIAIRKLYSQGLTHLQIAGMYGVSRPHIGDICDRTRWKHIP